MWLVKTSRSAAGLTKDFLEVGRTFSDLLTSISQLGYKLDSLLIYEKKIQLRCTVYDYINGCTIHLSFRKVKRGVDDK